MKARWSVTAVPSANKSLKAQFREYLAATQPARITEGLWRDLLVRLAPVSESYLRELVRDTGLPFDQPYAGIRQHSLEELEGSLREMLEVYTQATASGNRERGAVLPAAGDRREGSGEVPDEEESGEGRDGTVDAGVAGESRGLSGVGGGAEESQGSGSGRSVE